MVKLFLKGNAMKILGKTLTRGSFYSFLIILVYLIFSHTVGFEANFDIIIDLPRYLTLNLYGFSIAAVGLIFETKLDPIFKRAIHFLVLLGGFIFVFMTSGSETINGGRKVFISIVLFVFCYVAITLAIFAAKHIYGKIEKKLKKSSIDTKTQKKNSNTSYTPRYK